MTAEQETGKVAIRANPSFTCAGVTWGIEQLKEVLQEYGTIYIPNKNGLVHYSPTTKELEKLGAVFIEDPRDIPIGENVGNSMHGLSPLDRRVYIERKLRHFDFSCPLVDNAEQRVLGAIEKANKASKIAKILYACKDTVHPEPKAILELAPSHVVPVTKREVLEEYEVRDDEMYFAESQTTINVKGAVEMIMAFKAKFGGLKSLIPKRLGACFATGNRQEALDLLIGSGIDKLVVIGSPTSANTTQLVRIGEQHGIPVDFQEKARGLSKRNYIDFNRVGITGGASVPPQEGDAVMKMFREWGFRTEDLTIGKPEPKTFNLTAPVYDYRSGNIPQEILELTRTY